jgi:Leucine-rich repeat (LRR) protein
MLFDVSSVLNPSETRVSNFRQRGIQELILGKESLQFALISLRLDHNVLIEIPAAVFSGFTRLRHLHLSHNKIQRISPLAFRPLNNLQILDLSHNRLSSLSTQDFEGLFNLRALDVSHNPLKHFAESFFTKHVLLRRVFHTDPIICCLLPPDVTCEVSDSGPEYEPGSELGSEPRPRPEPGHEFVSGSRSGFGPEIGSGSGSKFEPGSGSDTCSDLLLRPLFTYLVATLGGLLILANVISIACHANRRKSLMLLSLAISDALFGCHLLTLSISDWHYRDRFSFYFNSWPSSIPCCVSVMTFLLSFQQALFSLVLMFSHTCLLVALPFRKQLHQRVMRLVGVIWALAALQVLVGASLVQEKKLLIEASDQLCQYPFLGSSYYVSVPALILYGFCILALCAISTGIVVHTKKSLIGMAAHSSRTNTRVRMMKMTTLLTSLNLCSLLPVLITGALVTVNQEVGMISRLVLTISMMSLSKLTNPFVYSFRQIQEKLQGNKGKK